jgi:broad specificity phosphatase PhoE
MTTAATHSSSATGASDNEMTTAEDTSRRALFLQATTTALLTLTATPPPAQAILLQFPCRDGLKNRYHFLRAGRSELEVDNIYSTNPLFLTNRENRMTDEARRSIVQACQVLSESGDLPTVAYHSLAANGMDTGDLLATELKLGRDRLLPEFTYLDPRGIGLWDSTAYDATQKAIAAMDYTEAGREGRGGRPPANEDGTPNETLTDQFIRLRQFISLQESRTSGENILVIFPDGTGPALLSCMIAGIPLNECHALDFAPGEIRLSITEESVLKLFAEKKKDPAYLAMLEEGKEILAVMRQDTSSANDFVSLKDQMADDQRFALDEAFARGQKEKQRVVDEERAEELLARRQEVARAQTERDQLKAAQQRDRQLQRDAQRQKRKEQSEQAAVVSTTASGTSQSGGMDTNSVVGGLGTALAAILAVGVAGGEDEVKKPAVRKPLSSGPTSTTKDKDAVATVSATKTTIIPKPVQQPVGGLYPPTVASSSTLSQNATVVEPAITTIDAAATAVTTHVPSTEAETSIAKLSEEKAVDGLDPPGTQIPNSRKRSVEEELEDLEAAQDHFQVSLTQRGDGISTAASESTSSSLYPNKSPIDQELDYLDKSQKAMDGYLNDVVDDGGDDWLRILSEIRDETDEEN